MWAKKRVLYRRKSFRVPSRKGTGLIVIIIVIAFLLSIGVTLITITSTGPKVSANIRSQDQAFNAAEAGFDAAWLAIEDNFANEAWISFEGHYLREPTGIDLPQDDNYFRKKTDLEILNMLDPNNDGQPDVSNVLFFKQPYIRRADDTYDPNYTYTVFLIDDEAGGGAADPTDALLVCIGVIGQGANLSTARIEIELAVELQTGG
ncbi:MAG: hypothetical protein DRJ11_11195 [Candidatus Aminicenantes bacterium]|nr:MAG: hypothetical protein DRJ11_11195 [Candidatus Aminicenantes bacterium]HHF43073.1 hypothetical protein [Candidatus Aminicenantes bacterium]